MDRHPQPRPRAREKGEDARPLDQRPPNRPINLPTLTRERRPR